MIDLMEYSTEENAQHWLSIMESEVPDNDLQTFRTGKIGMEDGMEDMEELKAQVKKLNAQATALKMDLHDLAEDLPTGWEKILEVATKAHQAYQSLDETRKRLAASAG